MTNKIKVAEAIRMFNKQFLHAGKCRFLKAECQSAYWFYDDADRRIDLTDGESHSGGDPELEVIHARYGDVMVCGLFEKQVSNVPV